MQRSDTKVSECRAISFDGDMTLWDFDKVMRYSLAETLEVLREKLPGSPAEALTVDTMIELRNEVVESYKHITNLEEVRFQAFIRTLDYLGHRNEELAAELNVGLSQTPF